MWDIVFKVLLGIMFIRNIVADKEPIEKIETWIFLLVTLAIRKL
jgi:hypothetical protein